MSEWWTYMPRVYIQNARLADCWHRWLYIPTIISFLNSGTRLISQSVVPPCMSLRKTVTLIYYVRLLIVQLRSCHFLFLYVYLCNHLFPVSLVSCVDLSFCHFVSLYVCLLLPPSIRLYYASPSLHKLPLLPKEKV